MTALAADRTKIVKEFSQLNFAAAADTYYENAVVGIDTADGLLKVGQAALFTWVGIGLVRSQKVAALNDQVLVNLFHPVTAYWFANSTGDAVDAADILKVCFIEDDQTVSETGNSAADAPFGIVWAVDSVKGVLVEPLKSIGHGLGRLRRSFSSDHELWC